ALGGHMSVGSMAFSSWRGSRIPWAELTILLALCAPRNATAAVPSPGPPITIRRATGTITIDGEMSDPGWQGVDTVGTWFETRVGDNVEPQVKNVGYLAYDDKFLYAGFIFDDPDPGSIR